MIKHNTNVQWTEDSLESLHGVGLRAEHYRDVVATQPRIGWFEVHTENYFGAGGAPLSYLERIASMYPISFHGVGLSIGSSDKLNQDHLKNTKRLVDRFNPMFVSEHLAWNSIEGRYFNDLFPVPYTEETLKHITARILQTQDYLRRKILIENISSYLEYESSYIAEAQFISELVKRSGCGVLLDINNVYVSSRNNGFDADQYLYAIPYDAVQEIHLAGFTVNRVEDKEVLIDTHNQRVCADVWSLYRKVLDRLNPVHTLIEWDTDLPPLKTLLEESRKARQLQEESYALVA